MRKVCFFASALRCFHVYYDMQKQKESEELKCLPDGNSFDMFLLKTFCIWTLELLVIYPTEYCFLLCGFSFNICNIIEDPKFFQGGFEIICNFKVSLLGSVRGELLMSKYKCMLEELCCELKNEIIFGCFQDMFTCDNFQQPHFPKREKEGCSIKLVFSRECQHSDNDSFDGS